MESKKKLRILAGACFAITAIYWAADMLRSNFYIWTLVDFVGYLLIVIGLFSDKPIISAIGSGSCLLRSIKIFIGSQTYISIKVFAHSKQFHFLSLCSIINPIFLVLFWIILTIAFVWKKNAKTLGIISCGVGLIRYIAIFLILKEFLDNLYAKVPDTRWNIFISWIKQIFYGTTFGSNVTFLANFPLIIGAFLVGFALDTTVKKISSHGIVPAAATANINTASQIQRLEKLKALLDNGVISQEEFDEKKKQILNL